LKEYKGEERVCIACTQLNGLPYFNYGLVPACEKKRILNEWIDFLKTD